MSLAKVEWRGLIHATHWPKHVTIMYLIFTTTQQFTVVSLFPFHRQTGSVAK